MNIKTFQPGSLGEVVIFLCITINEIYKRIFVISLIKSFVSPMPLAFSPCLQFQILIPPTVKPLSFSCKSCGLSTGNLSPTFRKEPWIITFPEPFLVNLAHEIGVGRMLRHRRKPVSYYLSVGIPKTKSFSTWCCLVIGGREVLGTFVENGAARHTPTILPLFRWLPGARLFGALGMR